MSPKVQFQTVKDWVWLALGAGGAINELFLRSGPERPYILAFLATLLGVPVLLSWDRAKREAKDETK